MWDDPGVDWARYERVVVRSVCDYSSRLDEFLAWCETRGAALRNPAGAIRFSADKRYLAVLAAAGFPVVPTVFAGPGDALPQVVTPCVVKPAVSAGSRRTGRFSDAGAARALADRITAAGDVALIQPYLEAVADVGETTVVALGGAVSHVLRKRLVLTGEGEAPVDTRPGARGAALAMDDPDLVVASTASDAELTLSARVLAWLDERFGALTYARLDLLPGPGGEPLIGEVELIEPNLYLDLSDGARERFAAAVSGT